MKSINSFLLTTIINDWLEDEVLSIWSHKYIYGGKWCYMNHIQLFSKDNGVCTSTAAAAAIIWWSRSHASRRKRMPLYFVHIHLKILILFIFFFVFQISLCYTQNTDILTLCFSFYTLFCSFCCYESCCCRCCSERTCCCCP